MKKLLLTGLLLFAIALNVFSMGAADPSPDIADFNRDYAGGSMTLHENGTRMRIYFTEDISMLQLSRLVNGLVQEAALDFVDTTMRYLFSSDRENILQKTIANLGEVIEANNDPGGKATRISLEVILLGNIQSIEDNANIRRAILIQHFGSNNTMHILEAP